MSKAVLINSTKFERDLQPTLQSFGQFLFTNINLSFKIWLDTTFFSIRLFFPNLSHKTKIRIVKGGRLLIGTHLDKSTI